MLLMRCIYSVGGTTAVATPAVPHPRFPSRFVRSARPNQEGAFEISGLPPSRYLAYAEQAIPRSAWTNLEYLAGIAPAAEPFSLGDGETRRISLPLRANPWRPETSRWLGAFGPSPAPGVCAAELAPLRSTVQTPGPTIVACGSDRRRQPSRPPGTSAKSYASHINVYSRGDAS